MSVLHGDFETRSAVDLTKCGADVYARDPSTDILCFSYAFDDEPVSLITYGEPLPARVRTHIESGGTLCAWNAAFERVIWQQVCTRKYRWPELKVEQIDCAMVRAYAMGLPGSLEKAAAAVGIADGKDMAGNRVMRQISQPKEVFSDGQVLWWNPIDDPQKFVITYEYCKKDIVVQREVTKRLLPLSKFEKRVYILDQQINERGVMADRQSAEVAVQIVELEKERMNLEIRKISGNVIATTSATGQFVDWINSFGVVTESIAKADVTELLTQPDLPKIVRQALELRQEAAKTSTAKIKAMILGACADGRMRGLFQYSAAGTRRWAGRRVQLQNLYRGIFKPKEIEQIFSVLSGTTGARYARDFLLLLFGEPLSALASCLRSFLIASPGGRLIVCDFSAIEARVLAWLAGEEAVLEIFRGHGKVYEHAAAGIYGVPMAKVTKDQRQIGKVAILALGYQGGKGAFLAMAKNYGVIVSDHEAEKIKLAWRAKNSNIVRYWYAVDEAAHRAILNPGQKFSVGPHGREVTFLVSGSFLLCRLPSGQVNCYAYPSVREAQTPVGARDVIHYKAMILNKWTETTTYGGSLVENITQALARDLLAEAMLRLDARGYKIVSHVHDEIVCDMPEGIGSIKEMGEIMSENPTWAKGLPLAAEGFESFRYRK